MPSINVIGSIIATSSALAAEVSYKQLGNTWTLGGDIASGIELSNQVMTFPNIPPSDYLGLWASLEINGTEEDAILLPWGNTRRIIRAPAEQGAGYIIIADASGDRIVGLNDAGTAVLSSRGFGLTALNANPSGLTYGDGLIWVLDFSDNNFYAYQRGGSYQSGRDIPFTSIGTETACAYYNGAIYITAQSETSLDAYDVTSKARILDSNPLADRNWHGMAISDSGVLWMGEGTLYTVYQITNTGATEILSSRTYPNTARDTIRGLATDGTYVYAYDLTDNGYDRYPIIDTATGELGAGTFTSLGNLGDEHGISLATIPSATLTDVFSLADDDTPYFSLSNGEDRVDVHYLRQPDGDIRLVLASTTDLLPANAVVKLYPAMLTAA